MDSIEDCQQRIKWLKQLDNEIETIFKKLNIDMQEFHKNFSYIDKNDFLMEYICHQTDLRNIYQDNEIKNYTHSKTKDKYTLEQFNKDNISYDDLSEKQKSDLMYECYVIECITQDTIKHTGWLYQNILNHYNISYGDSKWDYPDKFDKVIECLNNDNRFN